MTEFVGASEIPLWMCELMTRAYASGKSVLKIVQTSVPQLQELLVKMNSDIMESTRAQTVLGTTVIATTDKN